VNEREARKLVYARSGGVCEACGSERATEWHHRKNRSQGGLWTPSNGLHLGVACHRRITVNPRDAADEGYTVWSWQDHREVPVSRGGVMVLLDDIGGLVPVLCREAIA